MRDPSPRPSQGPIPGGMGAKPLAPISPSQRLGIPVPAWDKDREKGRPLSQRQRGVGGRGGRGRQRRQLVGRRELPGAREVVPSGSRRDFAESCRCCQKKPNNQTTAEAQMEGLKPAPWAGGATRDGGSEVHPCGNRPGPASGRRLHPSWGRQPHRAGTPAAIPALPHRLNPCRSFVGILAEARFKADNEVLQMLAGNSSQTLLERCSGESPAAAPGTAAFRWGARI